MEGSSLFLLQTNPNHPVVGVSPSVINASQILVTIQNSGVQLHEAFDQKVIYSWPQKTGSRWTLPAMEIQQAATKAPEPRYMGVMDHNFVCTWTQRDPSIDTHKKGFKSKVVAVLTDKMIHEAVILVHEDGALRLCSHDLEKISPTLLPPGAKAPSAKVVWTRAFGLQQSGVTFVLVLVAAPAQAAELTYVLHVYTLNPPPTHPSQKKRKMAEDQKGVSAIEQEITWNVSHEIKRFATKAKPGVATCSFDFANLTNYILWSDGNAEVFRFSNLHHLLGKQEYDQPPFLQSSTKLNAFQITQLGQQNKTKQVAGRLDREITGVASAPFQSFVALSGKRRDTGQPWLTLWDPIHGNLHGAREVNFEQSEDIIINPVAPDERVVQLAVSTDASYVVVALENHVAICPLYCPQPALGMLLNKMKSTLSFAEEDALPSFSSPILLDVVTSQVSANAQQPVSGAKSAKPTDEAAASAGKQEDLIFEIKEALDVDRESEEIEEKKIEQTREVFLDDGTWDSFIDENEREREAIAALLAATNKKDGSVIFRKFLEELPAVRFPQPSRRQRKGKAGVEVEVEEESDTKQKKKKKRMPKRYKLLSHRFVSQVGEKCLRLGMWAELEHLLKLGQLSTHELPDLIPSLLANNQFGTLRTLIRTSSDLPTGAVVSLLDYFTRPRANNQPLAQYLMNELARQKKSETPEVSPPTITEQEAVDVMSKRFLNVLVARRENFAFLLQYMKSFPLEQITYLLNYLTEWLEAHCAHDSAVWKKQTNVVANWAVPPLPVVIEWLGLLLDSRFSELVLLADSHPIIQRVGVITKEQVRIAQELGRFEAYLGDYRRTLQRWAHVLKSQSASTINSKHAKTGDTYIVEVLYI